MNLIILGRNPLSGQEKCAVQELATGPVSPVERTHEDGHADVSGQAGEPGEQRDERPLRPEEWAVLAASPESESRIEAVEDSPAAARAVRDDSVLPIDSLDADDEVDPLTPEFRAPQHD